MRHDLYTRTQGAHHQLDFNAENAILFGHLTPARAERSEGDRLRRKQGVLPVVREPHHEHEAEGADLWPSS